MNNFGKLIRQLRINKSMTQKELSKDIMSRSHLSDLERGLYFCSYDKFILLVRRLNINLLEFELMLNNSLFKEEAKLQLAAIQAINSQDIKKIEKSYNQFRSTLIISGKNTNRTEHIELLYKATIEYTLHKKIQNPKQFESIYKILINTEQWNYYELNLFNNFLFIFDDDLLSILGSKILAKSREYYIQDTAYNKILLTALINMSDLYLKRGDYKLSKNFSSEAKKLSYKNNMLFELVLSNINFILATLALTGNIDPKIYEYCNFLKMLGYDHVSSVIKEDIKLYTKISEARVE